MANEIHVVRIVTISSITFEFYYLNPGDAAKATNKIKKRLKEFESKPEGKAPTMLLVDIEDDFGIRQVIDVKTVAGIIHTNTSASAKTAEAVQDANRSAQSKSATGFQGTSGIVVANPP